MRSGLVKRLGRVETEIAARFGTDYSGCYETHFTAAWPGEDYDGPLSRCSEHGPGCLVEVIPTPSMQLRRVIILSGAACELS